MNLVTLYSGRGKADGFKFKVPSFKFKVPSFRFKVPSFRFKVPSFKPSAIAIGYQPSFKFMLSLSS